MNNCGLVTVIIPVYNVRRYLAEALDSVIRQTYENLEIIVIDDGSTDGSSLICDEFAGKDSRIKVIHQENRGLSTARNVGLDRMTGEYVAFLDSDDAFCPGMIQTLLNAIITQQADIAVCDFSVHKTQGQMKYNSADEVRSIVVDRDECCRIILNGKINAAPWNKLYRSKIWKELRFPNGHVYEGSYIAFDIMYQANKIVITDEKLVMHRNRPGSICDSWTLNNIRDKQYAYDHYYPFVVAHTPELFTERQLEQLRRSHVQGQMACYMQYSRLYPGDRDGRTIIRNMFVQAVKEVGLNRCSIPVRIGYYPILMFPRLCGILYRLYRAVKGTGKGAVL